jgi:hypothetical protein
LSVPRFTSVEHVAVVQTCQLVDELAEARVNWTKTAVEEPVKPDISELGVIVWLYV